MVIKEKNNSSDEHIQGCYEVMRWEDRAINTHYSCTWVSEVPQMELLSHGMACNQCITSLPASKEKGSIMWRGCSRKFPNRTEIAEKWDRAFKAFLHRKHFFWLQFVFSPTHERSLVKQLLYLKSTKEKKKQKDLYNS